MTVSDAPAPSRAATPLPRWRRPIAAVAALAVVLIAVAVGVAIGHRGARSRISPYTFDAEFNGPTGAGPNYGLATNYWLVDPCWEQACGNDSPTRYDASNAYLDGHGDLVLRADRGSGGTCGSESCRYTGVGLTMIDWAHGGAATWSQTYGTISARIKMPTGTGLWPAFWMAGADAATSRFPIDGEIDVVEGFGTEPTVVQEHAEFGAPDHTQHYGGGWALPAGESLADWHIYSVTWAPTGISWQVDGVTTLSLTAAQAGPYWAIFQRPFDLLLSLTVGGANRTVGQPDTTTPLPAYMLVDWIRVTAT